MKQAAHSMVNLYIPVDSGREVVIVCDSEKYPFAQEVASAYLLRGCLPSVICVPDQLKQRSQFLSRLLTTCDESLLLLPSADMWSSQRIASYLDFSRGAPSLAGKTAPCRVEVMPLESVLRVYGSDRSADAEYLRNLQGQLPQDTPMCVTSPGGTDLRFVSRSWLIHPWEVLTAPVEESVQGHIVADASVFFSVVASPLRITVEKGKIVAVDCADAEDAVLRQYRDFTGPLFRQEANRQLAEIGIGGNAGARISGCIMEDESMRGTCHFCFGNNRPYGGNNPSDWHGGTVVTRDPRFVPAAIGK